MLSMGMPIEIRLMNAPQQNGHSEQTAYKPMKNRNDQVSISHTHTKSETTLAGKAFLSLSLSLSFVQFLCRHYFIYLDFICVCRMYYELAAKQHSIALVGIAGNMFGYFQHKSHKFTLSIDCKTFSANILWMNFVSIVVCQCIFACVSVMLRPCVCLCFLYICGCARGCECDTHMCANNCDTNGSSTSTTKRFSLHHFRIMANGMTITKTSLRFFFSCIMHKTVKSSEQ